MANFNYLLYHKQTRCKLFAVFLTILSFWIFFYSLVSSHLNEVAIGPARFDFVRQIRSTVYRQKLFGERNRLFVPVYRWPFHVASPTNLFRANVKSVKSRINYKRDRWQRSEKVYSNEELYELSKISLKQEENFNRTLKNILKVRVPDTPNHLEVNKFIKNEMQNLGWTVEEDVFKAETTYKHNSILTFRNIITTLNPNACKRLVLACHYESKLFYTGEFLGATDSAVPCSMLIEMARNLDAKLKNSKNNDISLQFIFFDGEEAFKQWTDSDSLYGSRHLAKKWDKTPFPRTKNEKERCASHNFISELDRIELFVLLDLIGAKYPSFYSFYPQTSFLFKRLINIENTLNNLKILKVQIPSLKTNYFQKRQMNGNTISDDHIPFLKRDVKILHLIAFPFPEVWHTLSDNGDALDYATIHNLMKIFQIFLASYLHL